MKEIGAEWLGYDSITGDFLMISLGGFPGVVRNGAEPNTVTTIFGELYSINMEGLAALDLLESHPDFYERVKFRTDVLDHRAWMYTLPVGQGYLNSDYYEGVDSGIWEPSPKELKFWNAQEGVEISV